MITVIGNDPELREKAINIGDIAEETEYLVLSNEELEEIYQNKEIYT